MLTDVATASTSINCAVVNYELPSSAPRTACSHRSSLWCARVLPDDLVFVSPDDGEAARRNRKIHRRKLDGRDADLRATASTTRHNACRRRCLLSGRTAERRSRSARQIAHDLNPDKRSACPIRGARGSRNNAKNSGRRATRRNRAARHRCGMRRMSLQRLRPLLRWWNIPRRETLPAAEAIHRLIGNCGSELATAPGGLRVDSTGDRSSPHQRG